MVGRGERLVFVASENIESSWPSFHAAHGQSRVSVRASKGRFVMRTALMVGAAVAGLVFGVPASPAFADDSAMQQLQDEAHSSNDAANASSDEEAKDLSNQGFD